MDHIQKNGVSPNVSKENINSNNIRKTSLSEACTNQVIIKKFDGDFKIEFDASVKEIRGFILCCLVKNFQFTATNFKEFLQFQTKLHDNLCKKRELATIATHDFDLINSKHLRYAAMHKDEVKIQPLGRRDKMLTGSEYFNVLKNEAEAIRKEKKRSQVTGVYKFLQLLEDKNEFAFLEATDTKVCLSLPPLTNSENTKMSMSTKSIFLEVTSNFNAAICNKIMSELISKIIEMNQAMEKNSLELQQVRITDSDGTLKTLYPSKIDLKELESETCRITRP